MKKFLMKLTFLIQIHKVASMIKSYLMEVGIISTIMKYQQDRLKRIILQWKIHKIKLLMCIKVMIVLLSRIK